MVRNDNHPSCGEDNKSESEIHGKCSRCGRDFYHEGEVVDIFCKPKSDGTLGFEFTSKPHSKSASESAVAVLCFDCLVDWLSSQGLDSGEAAQIAQEYKRNLQRGD